MSLLYFKPSQVRFRTASHLVCLKTQQDPNFVDTCKTVAHSYGFSKQVCKGNNTMNKLEIH